MRRGGTGRRRPCPEAQGWRSDRRHLPSAGRRRRPGSAVRRDGRRIGLRPPRRWHSALGAICPRACATFSFGEDAVTPPFRVRLNGRHIFVVRHGSSFPFLAPPRRRSDAAPSQKQVAALDAAVMSVTVVSRAQYPHQTLASNRCRMGAGMPSHRRRAGGVNSGRDSMATDRGFRLCFANKAGGAWSSQGAAPSGACAANRSSMSSPTP